MTAPTTVQAQVEAHLAAAAKLYRELNAHRPRGVRLADREVQVAVLYALTPMSAAAIGAKLHLSEETVKGTVRRIFRKLRINERAELPAALANIGGDA